MKPDMLEIVLLYLDIAYRILYQYVCLDAIADFEMFMITIYFNLWKVIENKSFIDRIFVSYSKMWKS